jgi:hypothetical protein
LTSATVAAPGARSAVAVNALSALSTANCADFTAAAAAASDIVEPPEPPEPLPLDAPPLPEPPLPLEPLAPELPPLPAEPLPLEPDPLPPADPLAPEPASPAEPVPLPSVPDPLGVVVVDGVVEDAGEVVDGVVLLAAAAVAFTLAADAFTLAVVAVAALAVEADAVEADVVVVVPDWMSSSVSCALCSVAFASARSTSAEVGSIRASSWPSVTCSPGLTYTLVTLPEAPKLMFMVLAGERLPLPETVDCTTPLATVTTRSLVVDEALSGPTTTIAAATPPTATAPSATLIGVRS